MTKGSIILPFYNKNSDDNLFVPCDQIPADDECIILSASDLNGKDTVRLGPRELARVNPEFEGWLNDNIMQYFYFNKLNLKQNRDANEFRCFSSLWMAKMCQEFPLDLSQWGYNETQIPQFVGNGKRHKDDDSEAEEDAKKFCMGIAAKSGF